MAKLTTLEVRLSAALTALTRDWEICVDDKRCRLGEPIKVEPGNVTVHLSTEIVRESEQIDVMCCFVVAARRDAATLVRVPARLQRTRA